MTATKRHFRENPFDEPLFIQGAHPLGHSRVGRRAEPQRDHQGQIVSVGDRRMSGRRSRVQYKIQHLGFPGGLALELRRDAILAWRPPGWH